MNGANSATSFSGEKSGWGQLMPMTLLEVACFSEGELPRLLCPPFHLQSRCWNVGATSREIFLQSIEENYLVDKSWFAWSQSWIGLVGSSCIHYGRISQRCLLLVSLTVLQWIVAQIFDNDSHPSEIL